mgnify:CR=1 FL=1
MNEKKLLFLGLDDVAFCYKDSTIIKPGSWKKGEYPVKDLPRTATLSQRKIEAV